MAWQSDINRDKDAFAFAWLKHGGDSWQAALSITGPSNAGRALQISAEWVSDPYIIAKRDELLAKHGPEFFLPNKIDMARKLLDLIDNTNDKKIKREAIRDYNELMGFIAKPETKVKGSGVIAVTFSDKELKL